MKTNQTPTAAEYFNERWTAIEAKLAELNKNAKTVRAYNKKKGDGLTWTDVTGEYRDLEVLLTEASSLLHVAASACTRQTKADRNPKALA